MTDVMSAEVDTDRVSERDMPPAQADAVDEHLVGQLVAQARANGLQWALSNDQFATAQCSTAIADQTLDANALDS
jgi:hypothetical protein